jgi:hypothetical protein
MVLPNAVDETFAPDATQSLTSKPGRLSQRSVKLPPNRITDYLVVGACFVNFYIWKMSCELQTLLARTMKKRPGCLVRRVSISHHTQN